MNKNLIIELLFPLGLSLITFLTLWGRGIIDQHKQPRVWRIGVIGGAGLSLFSAVGFVSPFQLYPWLSYMIGLTFACVCGLYSTYHQPAKIGSTAEELKGIKEGKVNFLTQMAIGAGFCLFVMVLAGFTAGQQEGRIVNESVASAINRINKEMVSLRAQISILNDKVNVLNTKADSSAEYDSARMREVTAGQKKILDQGKKKR